MCRLTILPFTELLWCSFATTMIIASVGTTTSYHDMNARFQKSSTVSGIITTVAGRKRYSNGSEEDGVAVTSGRISSPRGIAFDKDGNLYIAALNDQKIFKVTASGGIITEAAGTGVGGYGGDGGKATSAMLHGPMGVTLDTAGDIYIADTFNNRIRKITMSTGLITTVAGNGNKGYSAGDNIPATSASLWFPYAVAVDPSGNMFIADNGNRRVRKVSAATGMITTIANNGVKSPGRSASGSATEYYLDRPTGIALDTSGNVYVVDPGRHAIFKITVSTGNISTVAGTVDYSGYNGDDILATAAKLKAPETVVFDALGNMYVSDCGNHRIRRVAANTGMISTIAGTGAAISVVGSADPPSYGEGGLATAASIKYPAGVAIDVAGNLYFVDIGYSVVRKVAFTGTTPSASVTSAPLVKGAPSVPVASTPTLFISTAPTVRPSTSISTAPTPGAFSSPSSSSSSSSISSSPSLSPTVRPSTSISMAPTPDGSPSSSSSPSPSSSSISSSPSLSSTARPSTSISMAPTPGTSSPSSSFSTSSSISSSPSSSPTESPSTSLSTAPTPGTSSPSSFSSSISSSPSLSPTERPNTSLSTAPTPGASSSLSSSSSPSSSLSSKASVAPSSTATQSSSALHYAQTIHLTIISLSSQLLLQLCLDA